MPKGLNLPGEPEGVDYLPWDFTHSSRSLHAHLQYCSHPEHTHHKFVEQPPEESDVLESIVEELKSAGTPEEEIPALLSTNQSLGGEMATIIHKFMMEEYTRESEEGDEEEESGATSDGDHPMEPEDDSSTQPMVDEEPEPQPPKQEIADDTEDDEPMVEQAEPEPEPQPEPQPEQAQTANFILQAREYASSIPAEKKVPECGANNCLLPKLTFVCNSMGFSGCLKHATDAHTRVHKPVANRPPCNFMPVEAFDSSCVKCNRTDGVYSICSAHNMCLLCLNFVLANALDPAASPKAKRAPFDCPGCPETKMDPQGHQELFAKSLLDSLQVLAASTSNDDEIHNTILLLKSLVADPSQMKCANCFSLVQPNLDDPNEGICRFCIWAPKYPLSEVEGGPCVAGPDASLMHSLCPLPSTHVFDCKVDLTAPMPHFPNVHCGTCFEPMYQRIRRHSGQHGASGDFAQHIRFGLPEAFKPCPGGKRVVIVLSEPSDPSSPMVIGDCADAFSGSHLGLQMRQKFPQHTINLCSESDSLANSVCVSECNECFHNLANRIVPGPTIPLVHPMPDGCPCVFCSFDGDLLSLLGLVGGESLEDALSRPPRTLPVPTSEVSPSLAAYWRSRLVREIKEMHTRAAKWVSSAYAALKNKVGSPPTPANLTHYSFYHRLNPQRLIAQPAKSSPSFLSRQCPAISCAISIFKAM